MKEFMNYETMFAQSIGLKEPWKIERAEFDGREHAVHVYVSASKTAKYPCPVCGKMCDRYDDEETEMVWRHGDVVFFPCYVHCRRPRVKCKDGIHVVTAPWARENSRYTLLFESYAMLLVEAMPVNQARKLLRIGHTSLTGILRYWVHKAVDEMDLSDVTAISADDTSFKKGQSYITVVIDLKTRRCIDVEDGRDKKTIENFSSKLEAKGGDSNKVTTFVSDMSSAYMSAKNICFPNAMQVIDKFHVKQRMLEALDEVRKEEQGRFSKSSKAGKKLLMIPESRQNERQKQRIAELSKQYPKTGRAYRMVQCLDEMYKCGGLKDATKAFNHLVSWLMRSRLAPMKKAA